ncbi:hypothetical protein HZH68_003997 [Vespula germanica]|uniref:Uncharacterized protein n=1 Tax=Vespula germanica TaxID=30212 RepID=A0A834KPM9_VESGE|nr:hypothetical protein HZH68_003997 [Vespula germanica]
MSQDASKGIKRFRKHSDLLDAFNKARDHYAEEKLDRTRYKDHQQPRNRPTILNCNKNTQTISSKPPPKTCSYCNHTVDEYRKKQWHDKNSGNENTPPRKGTTLEANQQQCPMMAIAANVLSTSAQTT